MTPAVALAVVLLSLAGLVGFVAGRTSTPSSLADPPEATSFGVQLEPFDDSRDVVLVLESTPMPDLAVHASGVITRSGCHPGAKVSTGTAMWAIDGVGRVALHLAEPPFRDLVLGSSGRDVVMLQRSLTAAGFAARSTGVLDVATLAAYNRLRDGAGIPAVGLVSRESYIWLPEPTVSVDSCSAIAGAIVAPGNPIATLVQPAISFRVKAWPPSLVPGRRQVSVAGVVVPLPQGKHGVSDPSVVAKLQRLAVPDDSGRAAVAASLSLARAVQAATLPASAVAGVSRHCVVSIDGTIVPVRVVDSSLGRSVVRFGRGHNVPSRVRLTPPVDAC